MITLWPITTMRFCTILQFVLFSTSFTVWVSAQETDDSVRIVRPATFMVGPDPEDRHALFGLLENRSVQRDLGLQANQLEAIRNIKAESKKRTADFVAAARAKGTAIAKEDFFQTVVQENKLAEENAIEEVLLPEQLTRLRQIAYRLEVNQLGLHYALTMGRLSHVVQIHDGQNSIVCREGEQLTNAAQAEIEAILKRTEAEILKVLTPEQRKRAIEAIGTYFDDSDANAFKKKARNTAQEKFPGAKP